MRNYPSVSIAMATYNGEKYIQEQLESLAAQSMLPSELVVTDDGSSDRTLEIIESFKKNAKFLVRIFRNETRLGYEQNFLKAAMLCSEEYVAYSDQDDVWFPNKLAKCCEVFSDPSVMLCIHSAETWSPDRGTGHRHPNFSKTETLTIDRNNPLMAYSGFALVFRRFLLDLFDNSKRPRTVHSLGGPLTLMNHDEWVWFLGCSLGSVVQLSDSLAFYRQHDSNTHGAPKKRNIRRIIELAISQTKYRELSVLELECAQLLNLNLGVLGSENAGSVRRTITKFETKAKMHELRSVIYDDNSSISNRIKSFSKIFGLGGYSNSRNAYGKVTLGRMAAVKDALFGVTGFFKFLR
jgi:glycosyltransferase involved in cell wall biosynthesis